MTRKDMFGDRLTRAAQEKQLRVLREISTAQGRRVIIDGKDIVLFASNNYLGLATHPVVCQAAIDSIKQYGFGAGASRLISGTMTPHRQLEDAVAKFLGTEAALLFGSGYAANVGVLTGLLGRGDRVFADRLVHASVIDGVRMSGAKLYRFAHNDPESLQGLLRKHADAPIGKNLIVTEGVFSMEGDLAPLAAIAPLAEKYGALLMVDDAHGFGLLGERGRGVAHEAGVAERVDIHVVTAGKTLGSSGGLVAGSRKLIDGLINFSRSFIYSTAPPPSAASAALAALHIVDSDEGDRLRSQLFVNVSAIVGGLDKLCYTVSSGESQIVAVYPEAGADMLQAGWRLLEHGVYVPFIRRPTVPAGTERFRISVTAEHTSDDIAYLIRGIHKAF